MKFYNTVIASLILSASCLVNNANAGLIVSAQSAIASSEYSSTYDIDNTIDQSGLSSTFISGVDDFDSFLGLTPTHVSSAPNYEWFSQGSVSSAWITYDLGSIFNLNAIALWVEESWAPHSSVSFKSSLDGVTYNTITSNITLPTNAPYPAAYPSTRYDFSITSARYFMIDFGACSSSGCSLGEIAFSATTSDSVPEPSTLAIFVLGMIGLASRRFKK